MKDRPDVDRIDGDTRSPLVELNSGGMSSTHPMSVCVDPSSGQLHLRDTILLFRSPSSFMDTGLNVLTFVFFLYQAR